MPATSRWQRLGLWLDSDSQRQAGLTRRREAREPGYGYLELPDCSVRYRTHGEGDECYVFAVDPPVVLEHYDALLRVLSPHARVIVLELPGFGFSPARRGFDFSLARCIDAVVRALDQLEVRGATLCFPCVSAYLALHVALARPDLVSRLVLAQAPDYAGELRWKQARDPQGVLARPVWGQLAMRAMSTRRLPGWFSLSVGADGCRAPITALAATRLRDGARWPLASAFQNFLVEGAAPPVVAQPVIALWGERDRSHRGTARESSLALAERVALVRWDDVGHFPELEAPERFVELLRTGPWPT